MKNFISSIAIAAALVSSSASVAEVSAKGSEIKLKPMHAHTIGLTDHTAVVYYVVQENGDYQIITTVGPNVGVAGNASRHRVTMSDGQSWSLGMDNGETATAITFSTNGESLFVASR